MKPIADDVFGAKIDGREVRYLAVKGAGVTILSSGSAIAIQMVATVLLARLLTPADFGVVAMVTTVSLLFVNFGLNGFTEAIIQRKTLDHVLTSNLFWINVSVGLILTIAFASAGSKLAQFYHNPLVADVAVGVSLTIVTSSTSVLHLALLKRAMRFTMVAVSAMLAQAASISVSIVLAWRGWGYRALIVGAITLALVQSIAAWSMCRWIPGFPRRVAGTGSMVRYAVHVYGRFIVNYLARNVDNLLVGWRFGALPLGFYKRAYDLFALSACQLTSPLANVAVSALSRFDPHSIEYRRLLLGALALMAFVGMGLSGAFTLIGKDLIEVLLGPKWEEAGQIFIFFSPGIGIMMVYYVHSWVHLSIGRTDRWLGWGLIEASTTCLLFLLMLPWGPKGIAIAWTLSFWILTIPAFWYAGRPIQLGAKAVVEAVWKPIAASVIAGIASTLVRTNISFVGSFPAAQAALTRMLLMSLLFVVLYIGAIILLHRSFTPIYQLVGLLQELSSLRRSSAVPTTATQGTVSTASGRC